MNVNLQVPSDPTERFWMRVSELKEAKCPDTGAYLRCSKGSRMTGRKRKWWAVLKSDIVRFTADGIDEAIEKAHKRLNK